MVSILAFVAIFLNAASHADASAFLQKSTGREHEVISREMIVQTLTSRSSSLLEKLEAELRPMFMALPKGANGNLDSVTVRYALHRYFVAKHGWHVRGLDPTASSENTSSSALIVKDRAPSYMQTVFDEHLHGKGVGLHELAVLAAAMADLVHAEVSSDLLKIFSGLQMPTMDALARTRSDFAVKAYIMFYLIEADMSLATAHTINSLEKQMPSIYPAWPDTVDWVQDFRQFHDLEQKETRNPFVTFQDTFDSTVDYAKELGHNFGSYQRLECATLKRELVDLEQGGSGRILLSRFYKSGVEGGWAFSESAGYLRNIGALDESEASVPSVIIPNYLTSKANCLTGSGFYSVCCPNECEGLISHLEKKLAQPHATPERVADLVASLPSDTVAAPRNLSSALVGRLSEIASVHGGQVPLHGRLMAQWMHHAYPRECPYPHATGTIAPVTPKEWSSQGLEIDATPEQMTVHVNNHKHEADVSVDIPWSSVEELVAHRSPQEGAWSLVSKRGLMACVVLMSFVGPLLRAFLAPSQDTKSLPRRQAASILV